MTDTFINNKISQLKSKLFTADDSLAKLINEDIRYYTEILQLPEHLRPTVKSSPDVVDLVSIVEN